MEINWSVVDMEQVGNKLAMIRESKKQTQDEFIEGCDIQYRQYSKYENGLQKPKYHEENFFKLLSKHDIDFTWLLYDSEPYTKQPKDDESLEESVTLYLKIKTKNGVEIFNVEDKPLKYLEKIGKYIDLTVK